MHDISREEAEALGLIEPESAEEKAARAAKRVEIEAEARDIEGRMSRLTAAVTEKELADADAEADRFMASIGGRVIHPAAAVPEAEDGRAVTMEGDFGIGSSRWPGLAKLAEESGELVQVLMKIVSMGGVENYNHWDGTDLLARLVEELGDVRAAMIFLCEANGISKDAVHARADMKLERFRHWHEAQQAALAATALPEGQEGT